MESRRSVGKMRNMLAAKYLREVPLLSTAKCKQVPLGSKDHQHKVTWDHQQLPALNFRIISTK